MELVHWSLPGSELLSGFLFMVDEIKNECARLAGGGVVKTREGLDRLNTGRPLHHIHCLQQWQIKAGLVFFRDQKNSI